MRTQAILLTLIAAATAAKFGDSLKQCDTSDKNALNSCLFRIVEDIKPLMPTGIPDINVPVLDPMFVSSITLRQGDLQSTFSQLQIRGLSKFITNSVSADADAMTLRLRLTIPELRITGQYNTDGRILLLAVKGSGTFWNVLGNVTVDAVDTLSLKSGSQGKQVLQVADQRLDINVSKMRMRLNNLFNGDPILGETVNAFLNENSQEVFNEVKPEISKQVGDLVIRVMNDALGSLPAEKFLSTKKQRN